METKAWTWIDKAAWGDGAWQQEADKHQYPDAATGLPCLMRRVEHSGAWCGYVGVAEGHPWFGKGYNDVDADVHGGLTYAAPCADEGDERGICHVPGPGEPVHVWWFGFDHAHSGDYCPAMERWFTGQSSRGEVYRDEAYVRAEVAGLARQLAAATGTEA